jgi:hypothetical protein
LICGCQKGAYDIFALVKFLVMLLQSEHMSVTVNKNEYFWNILIMGTKYLKNILMPCRNDMENIFHMYMDERQKMDEKFR